MYSAQISVRFKPRLILCYFYIQMSVNSLEEKTEKVVDRLICESCGEEFSCGARIGKCWCFSVEVKAETLAELREDFKNCLCEDCLKKII